MTINIGVPEKTTKLKPRVLVLGVGGGGCNALNLMIASKLKGVEFVACNTDAQSLEHCNAEQKIQLGVSQTQGLGAGSDPAIGKAAAEESYNDICEYIDGAHMAFITSGMGGGTGTGAVSVIARACKEKGILTVAVVTKPFNFEGTQRMENAEKGIKELRDHVDTLIVIPNQNLFIVSDEKTSYAESLSMADQVLHAGVRGITDLMLLPGLINLDFADVKSVMLERGRAVIGNGEAEGERRAVEAAESAISNPLLDHVSLQGAKGLLMNISGGSDMTLIEVEEAAEKIKGEAGPSARIIYGSSINKDLDGKMRVSIVATGIENIINIKTKKENKNNDNEGLFENKQPDKKNNLSDSNTSKLPEQTDLEDFTDPVVEVERNNEFSDSNDRIINKIQENQIKPSNVVLNFLKKYSPLKIFNRTKKEEIDEPEQNLSEIIPQKNEIDNKENKLEKKENEELINKEEINQKIEDLETKNEEKKPEINIEKEKITAKETEKLNEEDKKIEKKETPIEIQPEIQGLENDENNTKNQEKEPENTKDSNSEEDLRIPSFLRNQSN